MKRHFFYFILFIGLISGNSCKRGKPTEPPECRLKIRFQLTDKNNGENIGLEKFDFYKHLKIKNFINYGSEYDSNYIEKYFNIKAENNNTVIEFTPTSFFDFCTINSIMIEDKYVLNYSGRYSNDSIQLKKGEKNESSVIFYFLNDSLIDFISIKDFKTSTLTLPTIEIKK